MSIEQYLGQYCSIVQRDGSLPPHTYSLAGEESVKTVSDA